MEVNLVRYSANIYQLVAYRSALCLYFSIPNKVTIMYLDI